MRSVVLTFILGAFAAGTADADNCRVQQRVVIRQHVQQHAVAAVVTPVVVAQYLPFAVQVPTYSVGYNPQPQQAQAPDAVLSALEKLTLAVERLGAGQPQSLLAQAPVGQSAAHLQVLTVRCASCHDSKVSQKKGSGLTLLDGGKEVQLSPKQILRVLATTHDGTMPKSGPKLNVAEKRVVSQWIESLVQGN